MTGPAGQFWLLVSALTFIWFAPRKWCNPVITLIIWLILLNPYIAQLQEANWWNWHVLICKLGWFRPANSLATSFFPSKTRSCRYLKRLTKSVSRTHVYHLVQSVYWLWKANQRRRRKIFEVASYRHLSTLKARFQEYGKQDSNRLLCRVYVICNYEVIIRNLGKSFVTMYVTMVNKSKWWIP